MRTPILQVGWKANGYLCRKRSVLVTGYRDGWSLSNEELQYLPRALLADAMVQKLGAGRYWQDASWMSYIVFFFF